MSGGSEAVGVMTSRGSEHQQQSYVTSNAGMVAPLQSQPAPHMLQNMRLTFTADGTPVYKPLPVPITSPLPPSYQQSSGTHNGNLHPDHPHNVINDINVNNDNIGVGSGGGVSLGKKKRGRPRKYGPESNVSLAFSPMPLNAQSSAGTGVFSSPGIGGSLSPSSGKKARGRPSGSGKKHQTEALGSSGFGFTPHIITINAGEDISSKIMSFCQHGPRGICIISANGAISNVTLRQSSTSGGTIIYEGRYEILSLSGSFLLTETGSPGSRSGGLSVSLSGADGRVLGGGVAGPLTAASPVQVIVGSFIADDRKELRGSQQTEHLLTPSAPNTGHPNGATATSSPTSRGTLSESSDGGPGSPFDQNNQQTMSSMNWK